MLEKRKPFREQPTVVKYSMYVSVAMRFCLKQSTYSITFHTSQICRSTEDCQASIQEFVLKSVQGNM